MRLEIGVENINMAPNGNREHDMGDFLNKVAFNKNALPPANLPYGIEIGTGFTPVYYPRINKTFQWFGFDPKILETNMSMFLTNWRSLYRGPEDAIVHGINFSNNIVEIKSDLVRNAAVILMSSPDFQEQRIPRLDELRPRQIFRLLVNPAYVGQYPHYRELLENAGYDQNQLQITHGPYPYQYMPEGYSNSYLDFFFQKPDS